MQIEETPCLQSKNNVGKYARSVYESIFLCLFLRDKYFRREFGSHWRHRGPRTGVARHPRPLRCGGCRLDSYCRKPVMASASWIGGIITITTSGLCPLDNLQSLRMHTEIVRAKGEQVRTKVSIVGKAIDSHQYALWCLT